MCLYHGDYYWYSSKKSRAASAFLGKDRPADKFRCRVCAVAVVAFFLVVGIGIDTCHGRGCVCEGSCHGVGKFLG